MIRACNYHNTRLDYCNSILYEIAEGSQETLQRTSNKISRVVCDVGRRDYHTVNLLLVLHWLPIRSRTSFKVATMCFKSLRSELPDYLCDMVHPYIPTGTLRSFDRQLLTASSSKMTSAARRFSCICLYRTPSRSDDMTTFRRSLDSRHRQWQFI